MYDTTQKKTVQQIPLTEIKPPMLAMRENLRDETLLELQESIKQYGLLQPILLARANHGFEIIAGHRRYLAHVALALVTIDAIIVSADSPDVLVMRFYENKLRKDIDAYEEANYLNAMIVTLGIKQNELSKRIGLSPSYISERLKILEYKKPLLNALKNGDINFSVAREFAKIDDEMVLKRYLAFVRENGINPATATKWRKAYESDRELRPEIKAIELDGRSRPETEVVFHNSPCFMCETETPGNDLSHVWLCRSCLDDVRAAKIEIQQEKTGGNEAE